MHHSALISFQHANDLYTDILNDKNLSHLKPYLHEIGEHLSQLNKKVRRYIDDSINDVIIEYTDDTTNFIEQAQKCYMRRMVTKVKYEHLETATNICLMCRMLNDTIYMYNKTVNIQTKSWGNDFENLRLACNRLLNKYDCMLNDNNNHIDVPEADTVFTNMYNYIIKKLKIKKNIKTLA